MNRIKAILLYSLMGLFFLAAPARALLEPPDGFNRIAVHDDETFLLQPEGWSFKPVKYNAQAEGYFITEDPVGTNGTFRTGFSLDIAGEVRKRTRKTPWEYAAHYLARQVGQGQELERFSGEVVGMPAVGGRYLIEDGEGGSIQYFRLLANHETDTLYIYRFQAPKDRWDEAWATAGQVFFQYLQSEHEFRRRKEEFLQVLRRANRYLMEKWPDPGDDVVHRKTRASNLWTRSVYYEGVMEYYEIDPDPAILKYAVEWGESHDWEMYGGGIRNRNADYYACGSTYLALYALEQDRDRIRDIKATIDNLMEEDDIDDWDWIDALFMGMPAFARLSVLTGNRDYAERMHAMYMDTKVRQELWNPEDHLWWRDADFRPPYTEPNGEDCYWSRGNGWVAAALARVLDILPDHAPHRDEYEETLRMMLQALASVQREDGFWNVSLHDPDHYGGRETSGTALFTYAMAWAVNHGLVDAAKYEPVVLKAWNAMVSDAVLPDGSLGYVQSAGKEPASGQPVGYDLRPDFEDYGVGCFLLAGTEVYRLLIE